MDPWLRKHRFHLVVVDALDPARTATGGTPSLVVVNLPGDRMTPALLKRVEALGAPVLLVKDSGSPPPPARFLMRTVDRPMTKESLEVAVRELLPPDAVRTFPPAYVSKYAPLFDYSAKMRAVREVIEEVAWSSATVLLLGESGVGKDVAARAIHAASPRARRPFLKVNCAALPAELLEAELFGYERGAFTGAYRRKLGKFEQADRGTIFLDEIGEVPLALQAKLLHVLEDLQFSRVGGREVITADTRIVASTNRDLELAIGKGEFREDLYYRLNVVEIRIPPLRERREELPSLAAFFLQRFNAEYHRHAVLGPETLDLFGRYPWPGNIRELENFIRRLVVLGNIQQVREEIVTRLEMMASKDAPVPIRRPETVQSLRDIARRAAQEAERKALVEVLERVRWNRAQAARLLKVSYKTLLSKIAEFGLGPKPSR